MEARGEGWPADYQESESLWAKLWLPVNPLSSKVALQIRSKIGATGDEFSGNWSMSGRKL